LTVQVAVDIEGKVCATHDLRRGHAAYDHSTLGGFETASEEDDDVAANASRASGTGRIGLPAGIGACRPGCAGLSGGYSRGYDRVIAHDSGNKHGQRIRVGRRAARVHGERILIAESGIGIPITRHCTGGPRLAVDGAREWLLGDHCVLAGATTTSTENCHQAKRLETPPRPPRIDLKPHGSSLYQSRSQR